MRLVIIFALIVLAPAFAFAQEKTGKTYLGATFSPAITYRSLNYSSSQKWIQDIRDNEEIAKFGYTAGLVVVRQINNRIELETGWSFSNRGERTKWMDLVWSSPGSEQPTRARAVYSFHYIGIPIKAHYHFPINDKLTWFITTGVNFDFFFERRTRSITEFDGDRTTTATAKLVGYRRFNPMINIGAGFSYQLSDKFQLRLEPNWQRSIASIVADGDSKEFIYSFGIATSVLMKLGKK